MQIVYICKCIKIQSNSHKAVVKKKKKLGAKWGDSSAFNLEKCFNTITSKHTPCLVPDQKILSRLLTVSKAITSDGVEYDAVK